MSLAYTTAYSPENLLSILRGLKSYRGYELLGEQGLWRSLGCEPGPGNDPYMAALGEAIRCVELVHGIKTE